MDKLILTGKVHVGELGDETCNRAGCTGTMVLTPPDNCACHISPPCHYCIENVAVCNECGMSIEDDEE